MDYIVDGLGRRLGRKVGGESTPSMRYLLDGQLRIVAEANSAGAILKRYVYATRVNVPDFLVDASDSNKVYRVITDHLGSVRVVVGIDGTVKERRNYDSFGNELATSSYPDSNWAHIPFGFAGGLYDATTNLTRFGARDYDPGVGRWLSKDPLRFRGKDTNLFAYSGNLPTALTDPRGTDAYVYSDGFHKGVAVNLPGYSDMSDPLMYRLDYSCGANEIACSLWWMEPKLNVEPRNMSNLLDPTERLIGFKEQSEKEDQAVLERAIVESLRKYNLLFHNCRSFVDNILGVALGKIPDKGQTER